MIFLKNLLTLLILIFIIHGCSKDEEAPFKKDLYIFDVSEETEWDYWVVSKDGDYFYIKENNSMPETVFFKPDKNYNGYPIFFDSYGRPEKAVIQDYIFLFGNFRNGLVDISIVHPDGEISIERDIESEIDWDSYTLKSTNTVEEWSDVIRWAGHIAGIAACGIGIATTPVGGIGLPLVAIGCGATIASLAMEFYPEENDPLGIGMTTVGAVAAGIGCVRTAGVTCALGLAAAALGYTSEAEGYLEEMDDDVRMADALLFTGSGDVQVTLTWNNNCDLDLHVFDPQGEEIWWMDKFSVSGGILDYDDIDGYGPENIFWPSSQAPIGRYEVYVHHYNWGTLLPSSSIYTVLITAFDKIEKFTGVVGRDVTVHIADFDQNGIYPSLKSNDIKTISKAKKDI